MAPAVRLVVPRLAADAPAAGNPHLRYPRENAFESARVAAIDGLAAGKGVRIRDTVEPDRILTQEPPRPRLVPPRPHVIQSTSGPSHRAAHDHVHQVQRAVRAPLEGRRCGLAREREPIRLTPRKTGETRTMSLPL